MIEPLREISPATRALSAYMAAARRRALAPAVATKARQHILDTLAAMISGSRLHPGRVAIDYIATLGGARQACVVGTHLITCAPHAALANGMLAHVDETDDSHAPSRTHPGCAVVPAALAVAESVRASGAALIRAVVLGYDVAARVNLAPVARARCCSASYSGPVAWRRSSSLSNMRTETMCSSSTSR